MQAATFGRGIYQLELPECPGPSYWTGHMAARGRGLFDAPFGRAKAGTTLVEQQPSPFRHVCYTAMASAR